MGLITPLHHAAASCGQARWPPAFDRPAAGGECGVYLLRTAAMIGSQSVRTGAEAREMVAFDAGGRVKDRMRHLVADALGLLLRIEVHSAGVQDRNGAALVLRSGGSARGTGTSA